MSFYHLSILISFLIGLVIIFKIRSYDIYEKEPIKSMLIAFIIGGTFSVILSFLIYEMLHLIGIDSKSMQSVAGSFLIIGPVEEFSKFIGLVIAFQFVKKQVNEITDGVIYISCVALGFSIIENFFYANSGTNTQHLLIFRAFLSTPAHISFSCLIGYAYYRYLKENKSSKIILWAILIASILHGIYDAIIFSVYFRFLLIFYLLTILQQTIKIVQITNIISPLKPKFIDLFTEKPTEIIENFECPYCKSISNKRVIRTQYFIAYQCESCGYHISTLKDIRRIFKYFAPEYKDLRKETYPFEFTDGSVFWSIYASAFFNLGSKHGFYKPEVIDKKIAYINKRIVDKFYSSKIIPTKYLAKIMD